MWITTDLPHVAVFSVAWRETTYAYGITLRAGVVRPVPMDKSNRGDSVLISLIHVFYIPSRKIMQIFACVSIKSIEFHSLREGII